MQKVIVACDHTQEHTHKRYDTLDEWSARRSGLMQHSQETDIYVPVGFERSILAGQLLQRHISDCAVTGIGI